MHHYETLVQAIQDLKERGYTEDFNLKFDCLECGSDSHPLKPEEFEIDEVYRFEGASDPADSSVLYAISSERHGRKGILVSAYGAYTDPVSAEMIRKLQS